MHSQLTNDTSSEVRSSTAHLGNRSGRLALAMILLCSLAALGAAVTAEKTGNTAQIPLEISSKSYQYEALNRETVRVNSINTALVYGGLGLSICLAVTLASWLSNKQTARTALALVFGMISGVAAGALPSFVIIPLQLQNQSNDPSVLDLTKPLLFHLGLWVPIGFAAGLTLYIATRSNSSILLGIIISGLWGAILGTFFYEFAGAVLLPMDSTVDPVPATVKARFLAHFSVAVGIGLGLGIGSLKSRNVQLAIEPKND